MGTGTSVQAQSRQGEEASVTANNPETSQASDVSQPGLPASSVQQGDVQLSEALASVGRDRFKFVLVGSERVGKSAILERWVSNSFTKAYTPTLKVNFAYKCFYVGGKMLTIELWEVPSAAVVSDLVQDICIDDADAAVIVADACELRSWADIDRWAQVVREQHAKRRPDIPGPPLFFFANKSDKRDVKVTEEQVKQRAERAALTDGFLVSAARDRGLDQAFTQLLKEALLYIQRNGNAPKVPTAISEDQKYERDDRAVGSMVNSVVGFSDLDSYAGDRMAALRLDSMHGGSDLGLGLGLDTVRMAQLDETH